MQYFCNFVAKNNQKPSYQNGMKTTVASEITNPIKMQIYVLTQIQPVE